MSNKILIIDSVSPTLPESLSRKGSICHVKEDLSYDDFLQLPDEYAGLIIRSRFNVDAQAIDSKPSLQFIGRIGSGVEHIDITYAEKKGVTCFSTPEGNAPSVAEHCLGLLLSASRHIASSCQEVREGEWLRGTNKGRDLSSLKIGIIGFGHTGKAFAKLLKPFGCPVYIYDKYHLGFKEDHVNEVSLDLLMRDCDVISLHINYFPENKYFFNKQLIKKSKKPFVFINSSRGLAVKTADIISALENGQISYACLDVLEYENVQLKIPPKNEWPEELIKLSQMNNVLLTPHLAGQTLDSERRHAEIAFNKISKIMNF